MRRSRRFFQILVTVVPLLILGWLTLLIVRKVPDEAGPGIALELADRLTKALGHEVSVGRVSIRPGATLLGAPETRVYDIRVAKGKYLADGIMARVPRAELDIDIRDLLFHEELPFIANIDVYDPWLRITHSPEGVWNFQDMFRKLPEKPTRQAVGTVRIQNGAIELDDQNAPRNANRARYTLRSAAANVNGRLQFNADKTVTWTASGMETTGQAQALAVLGSYEPAISRLYLRIDASALLLSRVSPLLPPEYEAIGGTGTGRITLLRELTSPGKYRNDIQVAANVQDAAIRTAKTREPVTAINGSIFSGNDNITAALSGRFAGATVTVNGKVVSFQKPTVSGRFSGSNLQLQRILAATHSDAIVKRYPILRVLAPAGNIDAGLSGPLSNPFVTASIPATVRGDIKNGPAISQPTPLQMTVSGPLSSPTMQFSGTLPSIRYKEYSAANVKLNASMDKGRLVATFEGRAMGGSVSGQADFRPQGKTTAYTANLFLRGVDLSRIKYKDLKTAKGLVDADLSGAGTFDQKLPQGEGFVKVSGLKYDKWSSRTSVARLHSAGDVLYLDALKLNDPNGSITATGRASFKSETLNLSFEMDAVDLAALPLKPRDDGSSQLDGIAYVRDGKLTGAFKHPSVAGVFRGYGVEAGNAGSLDFVSGRFEGNRDRITIEKGAQAWRFPAFATISGYISNPLSESAQLNLSGEYERVDLQDLTELAGSTLEASGTANGTWKATGSHNRPIITSPDLVVQEPNVGRFGFDRLTASLTYDGAKSPSELRFEDVIARYSHSGMEDKPDAIITGHGTYFSDKTFIAHASGENVSIEGVLHQAGEYIIPLGTAAFSADLFGAFHNGKTENLHGTMTASTQGLKINEQDLGDLDANFTMLGAVISGTAHPRSVQAGQPTGGLYLTDLRFDTATDDLKVTAEARAIPLNTIRNAISLSPKAAADQSGILAAAFKSLKPLVGTTNATITVAGKLDEPVTTLKWTGQGVEIQDQPLTAFTGTAVFKGQQVEVKNAVLAANEAVVTIDGQYVTDQSLNGSIEATNFPLPLLHKWFPDQPDLQNLAGTADHIRVDASGKPDSPAVIATVDMRDIKWSDADEKRKLFGGRAIEFRQISSSTITIDNGKLNVADLSVKVLEPPHAEPAVPTPKGAKPVKKKTVPIPVPTAASTTTPATPTAREVYEALLSGSSDFSWKAPMIPEEAKVNLHLAVKDQGLGILYVFFPNPKLILDGRVEEASLAYTGTWKTLRDPRSYAEESGTAQPVINGKLNLSANKIASVDSGTAIRDLKAQLVFDGPANRLHVEQLTARSEISNPRYASRKGENLTVTGDLAIHHDANPPTIKVSAPKLVFAESPLPGLTTGAAVGEISTNDLKSTEPQFLTIAGTVFNPELSGALYIRNTEFRLPESVESSGSPIAFVLPFSKTNLKIVADKNVRIATSQLGATVHTSSTEPVVISGPGNDPRINGTLIVDRGTLQFPTAFFNIQRGGEISLKYPYYPGGLFTDKQLGVIVNISATTRLTATSVTGMTRRYTVTVEARGPINSPAPLNITDPNDLSMNPAGTRGLRLAFRSDPPDLERNSAALQRRMTEVLGGQSEIESMFAGSFNVSGVATNIFSQSILPGFFERSGIAGALGLEDFAVEYNRMDRFSFRVSRQLAGPLFVEYWRSLSNVNRSSSADWGAWEIKFAYHLRSNLQFSWTYNEQRTNAYLIEGVFKF